MELKKSDTVVGLFRDHAEAARAIRDLKGAGFTDSEIGVLMQDSAQARQFTQDTGTKAGEAAATGAATGGLLGGLFGLLAGVGALVIPGIGPIIAGGAIASTLAGAGIGAAAGGLIGALLGMGIPEEEARYYERGFREGGILVTVDAAARKAEARRILLDAGADFGAGATGRPTLDDDHERIELREEELRASKERVKAGEVRVRKEVVTDKKTIDVPVTREEVTMERRSVDRPATSDTLTDASIDVPVFEERVTAGKEARVVEELELGKTRHTDTKRVTDTVRREEFDVEDDDAPRG